MTDTPTNKPLTASPALVKAVIQVESSGDQSRVSEDGAIGLMQVLPSTGADAGFGLPSVTVAQLMDPIENVKFGTQFLSAMLNRYDGDIQRALIAYNAGHTVADKFTGDVSTLPSETRNYLVKVENALGGAVAPAGEPTAPAGASSTPSPVVAPQSPTAGRAVTPPRPQRPKPAGPPPAPPLPDIDLGPPGMAQVNPRRPIVPVLWQQAVAKFQQTRDPKDLASVTQSGLPGILALMGQVARRRTS